MLGLQLLCEALVPNSPVVSKVPMSHFPIGDYKRFLGSVRRACLDHVLVRGERQRSCVLRAYVAYCNRARPHQGLGQALPEPPPEKTARCAGPLRAVPVLGGLHHTYRRAACGR